MNYCTNLLLNNCVSPQKIKKSNLFVFGAHFNIKCSKTFFSLKFLLKYKIIALLWKILRISSLVYIAKVDEYVTVKFYNYFFVNNTLKFKNIWLNNIFLEKKKLNFFFNSNSPYLYFNLKNKKINFKLFKKYKKKKHLSKILIFIKKYLDSIHILAKKRKKNYKITYSWLKKRYIRAKSIFFYSYPSRLWNFFKWSKKLISHLRPIEFLDQFKKVFNYKVKLFPKRFFFKKRSSLKAIIFTKTKVKKLNFQIFKKNIKKNIYKTAKRYKKKRYYILIKKFCWVFNNFESAGLHVNSYKYYYYKKFRKFKRRPYKRRLRFRKPYYKYSLKNKKNIFYCFNKNYNKSKLLYFFNIFKNKSRIPYLVFKKAKKQKQKTNKLQRHRNQFYFFINLAKNLVYIKKNSITPQYYFFQNTENLYKSALLNFLFFHYLKIKIFKYKYFVKSIYKNSSLAIKTKFAFVFLKNFRSKFICNSFAFKFSYAFFLNNFTMDQKRKLGNTCLICY